MSETQLEAWFNELMRALEQKSIFINQGDDPVFFLVYPPRWSLSIYRHLKEWEAKLRHRGWSPRRFNLGERLLDFIRDHEYTPEIIEYEQDNPEEILQVNESIRELLHNGENGSIAEEWVQEELNEAAKKQNGLLLITGLEMIHPYLQIGYIEQRLQGKFTVPAVVLYPGIKTSKFGLRFLGIYKPDGNYRSRHIGGTRA